MKDAVKIKPKKSWSRYVQPYLPPEPTKPNETIIREQRIELGRVSLYETISLNDLRMPEGIDHKQINIYVDNIEGRFGDDDEVKVIIYIPKQITETNTRYKSEMKKYEKDLLDYNARLATYKQELRDWKRWVKQLDEEDLEEKIKRAEALLKRHKKSTIDNKSI